LFRGVAGRLVLVLVGIAVLVGGGFALLRRSPHAFVSSAPEGPALPPPPPPWTKAQLGELLDQVDDAPAEGLASKAYERDALRETVGKGVTGPDADALANRSVAALSRDFALGHLRHRNRFNWYIDRDGTDAASLYRDMETARADGRLGDWLHGLLPANPQYVALRQALADAPASDEAYRDRIRVNMERWRWLPRDFGKGDQLYVNRPTYRLEVKQGGETIQRYNVVIGATDMPTPALSSTVRTVIVNPTWIVPPSIVRKSHITPGNRKYVFTTGPDGKPRVKQRPGAGNALGKVKIEFPNPLAIYFHDTPSKSLFAAEVRAFSHGCVRVQNVQALAAFLADRGGRFDEAYAGDATHGFAVKHPWQANIVYFTLVAKPDGTLADVGDPYKMDAAMADALAGRKPVKSPVLAKSNVVPPSKTADAPLPAPVLPLTVPDPVAGNNLLQ
jgi:L,D-transpeptidase YcbB